MRTFSNITLLSNISKRLKQWIPDKASNPIKPVDPLEGTELKSLLMKDHEHLLILAAKKNDVITIKKIIEDGEDINLSSKKYHNYTPLMCAAEQGHLEAIVTLLSYKKCDINATDLHGHTALALATIGGHFFCVQELLKKGANTEKGTKFNTTPLCFAAGSNENGEIVNALLIYGANPNALTDIGENPLMIAADAGHTQVVSILLNQKQSPINLNQQSLITKNTALMKATAKGYTDIVTMLLTNKADLIK
ncbi:MAG: ankyrin repeat domain-containing protein [Rickettsiella sp.]|nr:ankyrin repeat domain-containing protein [Rickettsiella sp.]